MAFVLESGCKGIAFFDTMQDFSKEKCNIYLVFNKCLHITAPFVGAHIVFITRERVGGRDERQLKKGRTQMEQIQQILMGYGKGLGCFLGCFGMFWGYLGILCGVGSPPTALLAWVKNEHG